MCFPVQCRLELMDELVGLGTYICHQWQDHDVSPVLIKLRKSELRLAGHCAPTTLMLVDETVNRKMFRSCSATCAYQCISIVTINDIVTVCSECFPTADCIGASN